MNQVKSRSALFLMELMAAILIFSFVSAICLRMFAKVHQMNEDTSNLDRALSQVRNVTELMKHKASPTSSSIPSLENFFPNCILEEYPHLNTEQEMTTIYFDEDWSCCPAEYSAYCMQITPATDEASNLFCCHMEVVSVAEQTDVIYSLDFKLNLPNQP